MKKTLLILLCGVLILTSLAGCSGKADPAGNASEASPASSGESAAAQDSKDAGQGFDILSLKTLQDLLDLEQSGRVTYVGNGAVGQYYVRSFTADDILYRVILKLTDEVYDEFWAVDYSEDGYEAKELAILGPVPIIRYENLSAIELSEEEIQKLVGGPGSELVDRGWQCWGYNFETKELRMDDRAFSYYVTYEGDVDQAAADMDDPQEAIRPVTITSIAPEGYGDTTDLNYSGELIAGEELELEEMGEGEVEQEDIGMLGGWLYNEDILPTAEDENTLKAAVANLEADAAAPVTYQLIANLGNEPVAGTNYCFLVKAEPADEAMPPYYQLMFIYKDLDGNCTPFLIQPIEPGTLYGNDGSHDLSEIAIDAPQGALMGGWSVAQQDDHDLEVFTSLNLEGLSMICCLSKQVVAGTNYCFLAQADGSPYFIYAYEDLEGNTSLVNFELFYMEAFV